MNTEIIKNIYVGTVDACSKEVDHIPRGMIHATKTPCHQKALGYSGSLPPSDPHYLFFEKPRELYLNMIDADARFFRRELFDAACRFIDRIIKQYPVIIHCNLGVSRSPSIALVYVARNHLVPNCDPSDLNAHLAWLSSVYPAFSPSVGISEFLRNNWESLIHEIPQPPQAA